MADGGIINKCKKMWYNYNKHKFFNCRIYHNYQHIFTHLERDIGQNWIVTKIGAFRVPQRDSTVLRDNNAIEVYLNAETIEPYSLKKYDRELLKNADLAKFGYIDELTYLEFKENSMHPKTLREIIESDTVRDLLAYEKSSWELYKNAIIFASFVALFIWVTYMLFMR